VDPRAGRIATASGVIGAVGVVSLIMFYVLVLATQLKALGQILGTLNDVCIALQYLLLIPVAVSLRRILRPEAPALVDLGTIIGIASMLAIVSIQAAFVLGAISFEQEALWVTPSMLVGVGAWLITTGTVARSTGRFPHSLRMSLLAVPYLFYPLWAFWLARHLRRS
jgi:hypothetical protein